MLEEWSIVFGIIIAYYITYGTKLHLDSEWSWRLPFLLQMIPAIVLAFFVFRLPFSPRWLASQNREQEALDTLVRLRGLPAADDRVRAEWIEVRAEATVQKEIQAERHPKLQDGSVKSTVMLELASYGDTFRKNCYKRTLVGVGLMFFQVGINCPIDAARY